MNDSPLVILLCSAVCAYLFRDWLKDYQSARIGNPNPDPFLPGAFPCNKRILLIAVAGSMILLGLETWGEYFFNISEEQKEITALFLLMMISASFIEEVIFRGYLFFGLHRKIMLILSCLLFSFIFAMLHEYIWIRNETLHFWEIHKGAWQLNFSTKGLFSTSFIFLNSLWFYFLRFSSSNPHHSLLPCILAHLTKNLGVFVIKLADGKVYSMI